jgi:acetyl esterase/lipase
MSIRTALPLVVSVILAVVASHSSAQDVAPSQLAKWLKRYPAADTDNDGVLSLAEAKALRDQVLSRRGNQGKVIAPEPTQENVKYGPYDRNVLDVWVPESKQPTPLIVFIHGGGFVGGSKDQVRSSKNVQQALERGVAFASIQYRFRHPDEGDSSDPQRAAIQDILRDSARAIQFLRHHADDYNLDPSRIACYGGSAGAGTSIWLAFRDDLADPNSDDPVLRQSSRISAAGMLNGQFTYDLKQWDQAFASRGGNLAKTHGRDGKLELHRFFGLSEDEYNGSAGETIRADVDMRSMISADDPPVFIQTSNADQPPRTRGIYNHHPLHAELIEQRCEECGVHAVCLLSKVRDSDAETLKSNPDVMMDFFFECLDVSTADSPDSGVTPLPVANPAEVGIDAEKLDDRVQRDFRLRGTR